MYDAAGNVLASVDELGRRTSFAYDQLNRLVQTTNGLGGLSTVVYDAVGNVLARVNELGNRTRTATCSRPLMAMALTP